MIWLILCSKILLSSADKFLIKRGADLSKFVNAWFMLSRPAKAKSYLFKNPPFCFFERTRLFCRLNFLRMFVLGQYKTMKCLLRTQQFDDQNLLKNHYITDHKINSTNWFFKALFKENKGHFFTRKTYMCETFLRSKSDKKKTQFFISPSKRW